MLKKFINLSDLVRVQLCPIEDLNLKVCIGPGGQSFTWKCLSKDKLWAKLVEGLLIIMECDDEFVYYYCFQEDLKIMPSILKKYFRLDDSLDELIGFWRQKYHKICKLQRGIRIIDQSPFETFISFICSQNNMIPRIIKMLHGLNRNFGKIRFNLEFEGMVHDLYEFPEARDLIDSEDRLRKLGFGYRAKFIDSCAKILAEMPLDYLSTLRNMEYPKVFEELLQFPGIGPKVADCIALFGLNKLEAVPLDRHMLKVAADLFVVPKSMTIKQYKLIGDKFRRVFGNKAGWAQSLLFTNQLREFKNINKDNE